MNGMDSNQPDQPLLQATIAQVTADTKIWDHMEVDGTATEVD
jgi:hypothetical protein